MKCFQHSVIATMENSMKTTQKTKNSYYMIQEYHSYAYTWTKL